MMDTNIKKKKTQLSGPDGNNEAKESNVIIQIFGVHYYCPLFSL